MGCTIKGELFMLSKNEADLYAAGNSCSLGWDYLKWLGSQVERRRRD